MEAQENVARDDAPKKPGVVVDDEGYAAFELDAFQEETEWIAWTPPNSPKGRVPFEAEIRMNAVSADDLHQYREAQRDVRKRNARIAELDRIMARHQPEDTEYIEAKLELEGDEDAEPPIPALQGQKDETDTDLDYIWFPTVKRTNAVLNGKPVDLSEKNPEARDLIRQIMGMTAVNGVCTVIIQRVNNKVAGKGQRQRRRKQKKTSGRG